MGRRKAQLSCFRQQGPVPLPKGQRARLHRTRTTPGNGLHAVVPQRWVSWRHAVSAQGSSISSVCWRGRVQIRKLSDAGVATLYSRHVLLIIVDLTDRHAQPVLYAVTFSMSSLLPAAAGYGAAQRSKLLLTSSNARRTRLSREGIAEPLLPASNQ